MKILCVENISKLYRLGEFGLGTLKEDFTRFLASIIGKKDPYAHVTSQNIRETEDDKKYLWALQNISFSLDRGDTLGLIGKNGSGKSTLLKIISKITKPTQGKIYLNGSVSSLLEIGAGFNPRLTGRENIYMSGAVLGMRRIQIETYYEDIIEFSGVRRFIDTPVSRYSSGMYLRLAFSVAAHLQSDILILDEVLAVGDYSFKQQALDKIKQIAQSNRSVIYVAHNLNSVRRICNKGLLLEKGRIKTIGNIHHVIQTYTEDTEHSSAVFEFDLPVQAEKTKGYVQQISILNGQDKPCSDPSLSETWKIKVDFRVNQHMHNFQVMLRVSSTLGVLINVTQSKTQRISPGDYSAVFKAEGFHLGIGVYLLSVTLATNLETFETLNDKAALHISPVRSKDSTLFVEPHALVASPFKVDLMSLNGNAI